MNFGKIFDLITKNDINPDEVFNLIEKVRTMDLDNEDNIRQIIRDVSVITKKEVDEKKENMIVNRIKNEGINENLLDEFT